MKSQKGGSDNPKTIKKLYELKKRQREELLKKMMEDDEKDGLYDDE